MNIIYYNALTVFDELSSDERYLVAIDANLVSTHQVELPKMSLSKAKKAIPFLLEDVLLNDIEELDFFVQTTSTPNFYDVIVIEKQVVSELQEKIKQSQLEIQRCVVDFMLLPYETEKVCYIEDEQEILFRSGCFLGGRIDKTTFAKLFTDEQQLIKSMLNIQYAQEINLFNADWMDNWKKILYQWRVGIAVILLLIVLMPIQLVVDNYYLNQQIQAQRSVNQSAFKKRFPKVRRIIDLPAQVKQKLNQALTYKVHLNDDLLIKLKLDVKPNVTIKGLTFKQKKLEVVR